MAAAPGRPRRWLPWLLAMAVVVLAAGAAVVGEFYSVRLQGSLDRVESSIAEARHQQRVMVERVREAEIALAERAEQLESAAAGGTTGAVGPRPPDPERLAALAAELDRLADGLDGGGDRESAAIDWPRLRAELRLLREEALRLPLRRQAGVNIGGRELRLMLEQAEQAAALGDAALTALMLDGAQQLLRRHYGGGWQWREAGRGLADQIARVRAGLGPGPADTAWRLRELAGEVRGLAEN